MPIQLLGAIIGLPGTDAKPCAPERKAVFTKGALEEFQARHGDGLRIQGEKEAGMPGLKVVPGELPSICLFTGNDKAHAYTDKGQVHVVSEIDSKLQWSGKPSWLGELMPSGNVRMLDPGTLVAYLVCSIDELVLALQEHFDRSEINNIAKWGAALLTNWNGHPPSVCYMVKDPETVPKDVFGVKRKPKGTPLVAGRCVLMFRQRTRKCIIGVRGNEVIMRREGHEELVVGTLGRKGSLNTILEFKENGSIDVLSHNDFKRIATYHHCMDLVLEAQRLKFQQGVLDAICKFGASPDYDYSLCREVFDVRSLTTDDLNPAPIGKSEASCSLPTVRQNLERNVKILVMVGTQKIPLRDEGAAWPVFWDTGSYATFEDAERHGATYPGETLEGWVNVVDMLVTAHAAVRCIDSNTSCACRLYDSRWRKRHIDLSMRAAAESLRQHIVVVAF